METTATLATAPNTPRADKRPIERTVHGVPLRDDYAWLKAENWQEVLKNPAVLPGDIRAYLDAENAHARAVLAPTEALQAEIFGEMKGRLKPDDQGVPVLDGPWGYFTRYRAPDGQGGGQHPLYCRVERASAFEVGAAYRVLLDCDARAQGKAFYQLGGMAMSPDHSLLGWGEDDKGSEFFTLRVLTAVTGEVHADVVPQTSGGMVWAADGSGFFYVRMDAQHRPEGVFLHLLGTEAGLDRLVYKEPDQGMFVGIHSTLSREYLVIDVHNHVQSEVWLVPLAAPMQAPLLVAARRVGVIYEVAHHPSLDGRNALVVRTNAEAENYKLVTVPVALLPLTNWAEAEALVPHDPEALVQDFGVVRDWLVWLEMRDALPVLKVSGIGLKRGLQELKLPEAAYDLQFDEGAEFASSCLRYRYSSLTTPAEVWDWDVESGGKVLRKRQEVPSGHNPADYCTARIYATAPDGAQVPVSVLWKKTTDRDGLAPGYVTGYGAYGHIRPVRFSIAALSLVDRGWIYAIAHIRGGKEKGERWYTDGKLAKKTNTFTDFIAAAEAVTLQGFAKRGRLVAQGGSAGGMLMGAVANLAPEGLFAGIIADVPFVDVLNTMLDDTLPLTPPEWPEWGDPIRDPAAFEVIKGYSPYDNVRAKDYPAILAQGGLTDPRVTYWEPAKWVAKLREVKTGDAPLLLWTNMDAGHGGASGRYDSLKEVARELAFALAVAGK